MLRQFVGVWLVYWLAVALLPVRSIYPSTLAAIALQLGFVLLVIASHLGVTSLLGVRRAQRVEVGAIEAAPRIVAWALAISTLGLLALAYDKVAVQGIDYSEGVAFAREEWRRLGEEREGAASSIFSALGYLFGSAYYVAMVLALTQMTALSARQRFFSLLGVFMLVLGNSVLTGGRSSILLLVAVGLSAMALRRCINMRTVLPDARLRSVIKIALAVGFGYTVYVFYQRAASSGVDALVYAFDFLPFLGVEAADWYRSALGSDIASALSSMLVLTLTYITHSFATVAAIIDEPREDVVILFVHLLGIMSKLGLAVEPVGEWFLAGRFPSLPGALWYQFGPLGFVVGSLLIGVLSGAAVAWAARRPKSLVALGAYVLIGATLLLSPALFALDFLSAPFVAAAFVFLARISSRRGSHRSRRPPSPAAVVEVFGDKIASRTIG